MDPEKSAIDCIADNVIRYAGESGWEHNLVSTPPDWRPSRFVGITLPDGTGISIAISLTE